MLRQAVDEGRAFYSYSKWGRTVSVGIKVNIET